MASLVLQSALVQPQNLLPEQRWNIDTNPPIGPSWNATERLIYTTEPFKVGVDILVPTNITKRLTKESGLAIPADLMPETIAISATGVFAILGILASMLFLGTVSVVFWAPLLTSAVGGLFIFQAIRRHE